MRPRFRTLSLVFCCLAGAQAATPPAGAAEAPPPAGVVEGWHIVRPGDTLEGITLHYLGSPAAWRDNWRLNPFVVDPDLLEPGWRLRVLMQPAAARPAAQVRQIARRVETQPTPQPWSTAMLGELLLERDGVRTFSGSSTELALTDGSRLLVTENSLLFLRLPALAPTRSQPRAIEIIEGQADLELQNAPGKESGIEIVLGAARAKLRPGTAAAGQARSRRAMVGNAQLMVYRGDGEVEAGGQRVELPPGSGTSVPASGPPAPPEPLLPAPRLLRPAAGTSLATAEPAFAWEPVAGAVSYVVELCGDPDCGHLQARAQGVRETSWRPATALAPGAAYWRATAVGASGLDGFPATSVAFTLVERPPDTEPPTGSLALAGQQLVAGGKTWVLPTIEVRLAVSDPEGPLARLERRIDGEPVGEQAFAGPWANGDHVVTAEAADAAGHALALGPLSFSVDGEPPLLEATRAPGGDGAGRLRRWLAEQEWRAERGRWTTWKWIDRARDLRGRLPCVAWRVDDEPPAVRLTACEALWISGDAALELQAGETLLVSASDEGCGLAELRAKPRAASGAAVGAFRLELSAADRLGNERAIALVVSRRGR
jgi:hypothetical protein